MEIFYLGELVPMEKIKNVLWVPVIFMLDLIPQSVEAILFLTSSLRAGIFIDLDDKRLFRIEKLKA